MLVSGRNRGLEAWGRPAGGGAGAALGEGLEGGIPQLRCLVSLDPILHSSNRFPLCLSSRELSIYHLPPRIQTSHHL